MHLACLQLAALVQFLQLSALVYSFQKAFKKLFAEADSALRALKRWPVGKALKGPKRPTRLEPPYLDDPTFVHPDQQNQGEREWLMKHNGGGVKELPGLPDDYEWVKDAAEKDANAWIAVKKRMSKAIFRGLESPLNDRRIRVF